MSYVNDANGWRAVGAGAADWHISPKAILKGDFEYQHKVERSFAVISYWAERPCRSRQSVSFDDAGRAVVGKAEYFDTFNTGSRLDYDLPHAWRVFAEASYSHSLIDDNVIYAYGTPFDANGNVDCPGAPNAPAYFFCPAVPELLRAATMASTIIATPANCALMRSSRHS